MTEGRTPTAGPGTPDRDRANLAPTARRVHPGELTVGDALLDGAGTVHRITALSTFREGRIVCAVRDDHHRVWLWDDEVTVAILRRWKPPTLTCYARVLDMSDDEGWAAGDPAVIGAERESMTWEPFDGNPVAWAVDALHGWGTLQPSSSPPYDGRTWYTTTWTDWRRLGAVVDVSAHLAGFTRAEAEQIGLRITAPPAPPRPAPISRLADRSLRRDTALRTRTRGGPAERGLDR